MARASAIIGALAWIIVVCFRTSTSAETNLINGILLLGILVIVPLGVSLVATPDRKGCHSLSYKLALLGQPIGALAAIASFYYEPGLAAAMLASVWFVATGLIAGFGLWRFLLRGFRQVEELSIDMGLVFLPVGGVWLMLSRLALQPLGFGDTIVLLTAVHFHFAGFAAPILAGLAGRVIDPSGFARRLFGVAVVCIITGTPVVAAGITASPLMAFIGAIVISSGLVLLTMLVLGWVLSSVRSLPAQALLVVSSISSVSAMLLASVYAYSIVAKRLIVDIPRMAIIHGMANAFGFGLCGLIAWSIVRPISRSLLPGVPFSKLSAGMFAGPDYFQRVGAISLSKPPALGLVDDLSSYRRDDFDPRLLDTSVRLFYEETFRYKLIVRPFWRLGFRLGARLANRLGATLGQMRLPVSPERLEDCIESKLFPLDDSMDGRTGVRAWVRTYEGTDRAMYVAAYATHTQAGNTYMNIAFPIPGGNISSILHLAHVSDLPGALALSTLPAARAGGDQGVYFANKVAPTRLPINEVITVWAVDSAEDAGTGGEQPTVKATHEMWICGIKFLKLTYDIFPLDVAD